MPGLNTGSLCIGNSDPIDVEPRLLRCDASDEETLFICSSHHSLSSPAVGATEGKILVVFVPIKRPLSPMRKFNLGRSSVCFERSLLSPRVTPSFRSNPREMSGTLEGYRRMATRRRMFGSLALLFHLLCASRFVFLASSRRPSRWFELVGNKLDFSLDHTGLGRLATLPCSRTVQYSTNRCIRQGGLSLAHSRGRPDAHRDRIICILRKIRPPLVRSEKDGQNERASKQKRIGR